MGGVLSVSDVPESVQYTDVGNSDEQLMKTFNIALAYGQTTTIDLTSVGMVTYGSQWDYITEHIVITKAMGQLTVPGSPETQAPLAESPVVTVAVTQVQYIGTQVIESSTSSFTVSPDNPIYLSKSVLGQVRASLLSDSQLCLACGPPFDETWTTPTVTTSESQGYITGALIQPYQAGAREAQLVVEIGDFDVYPSDYVVTVTDMLPYVEPVLAQSVTLGSEQTTELTFTLRSTKAFAYANNCLVSLMDTTGRMYDSVTVYFPGPTVAQVAALDSKKAPVKHDSVSSKSEAALPKQKR